MKKELKEGFVFYLDQIRENVTSLGKWLLLAVLTGCVVGGASTLFAFVLTAVTSFRQENGWVFFLLPVAGLIIVFLYQTFWNTEGGAQQVFATIASTDDGPLRAAPLVFVSTALTHLTGGSAGREGAGPVAAPGQGRPTRHGHVRHERGFCSAFWNADGGGCFRNGSGERGRHVLHRSGALCDLCPDRQ